jgi:hypothetical protein
MKKKYSTKEEAAAAKNARRRERYASDPAYRSKVDARNNSWRAANKDIWNAGSRERDSRNPAAAAARRKKWRDKNPAYGSVYRARPEVSERMREYRRSWMASRLKSDPEFRILQNCRSRLVKAAKGALREDTTKALVGCSTGEFRARLESMWSEGMSWDNYGKGGWHIDHIRPLCSFDLTAPEQQRIAFHYTNCQPLWEPDNWAKGGKWEAA